MTKKMGVRLGRDKQPAPEEFLGVVLCRHAVNRFLKSCVWNEQHRDKTSSSPGLGNLTRE